MSLILDASVVTAAVAIIVAFYKHKTLAGVVASAKKEIAIIEAKEAAGVATFKADYVGAIARIKALL